MNASGQERIYVAVSFEEKEQAKAAGAKYDNAKKSWYVEPEKMADFRAAVGEKFPVMEPGQPGVNASQPIPRDQRHYLDVPFEYKDMAKAIGAKYDADPSLKAWYVPKAEQAKAEALMQAIQEKDGMAKELHRATLDVMACKRDSAALTEKVVSGAIRQDSQENKAVSTAFGQAKANLFEAALKAGQAYGPEFVQRSIQQAAGTREAANIMKDLNIEPGKTQERGQAR